MPSPFSNSGDGPQNEARPSEEETITVTGEFWCDRCFEPSEEAVYHASAKRLFWDCIHCGHTNAVVGIEL